MGDRNCQQIKIRLKKYLLFKVKSSQDAISRAEMSMPLKNQLSDFIIEFPCVDFYRIIMDNTQSQEKFADLRTKKLRGQQTNKWNNHDYR